MTDLDFRALVVPYTMTSTERIDELYNSLEYIRLKGIEGDIVECGVWKGGNILGILEYLQHHNMTNRTVWLFDTFEGMTPPSTSDVDYNGNQAADILDNPLVKAYCSLEDVKRVLATSSFPSSKIKFIKGDVSQTLLIPDNIPNKISLLRLDTDWYNSTLDELTYLYPRLSNYGVLIVDDYGHWKGCKLAVDEYFKDQNIEISAIDYTGIKIIKK